MRTPSPSHLGALREGFALLRRHPFQMLGLALLAMVLAQLGPALELAAGVAPSLVSQGVFGLASILPLEMYIIPQLQTQLCAASPNSPAKLVTAWRETFDGRWLK